jgi:hypothetical protein
MLLWIEAGTHAVRKIPEHGGVIVSMMWVGIGIQQ